MLQVVQSKNLQNILTWQSVYDTPPSAELNFEQCLVVCYSADSLSTITIAAMIVNSQFLNLETKEPLLRVVFWALYP